jgi:hypothetical protein
MMPSMTKDRGQQVDDQSKVLARVPHVLGQRAVKAFVWNVFFVHAGRGDADHDQCGAGDSRKHPIVSRSSDARAPADQAPWLLR